MKAHHLIRENSGLIKHLCRLNINMKAAARIEMYDDYIRLLGEGHKKLYIMNYLSEQYNISERCIYDTISKMEKGVA
jgi:predicted DNA-binding protein YlxM (UPF0122 family)